MIALVGLAGALVTAVALASSAPASCADAKDAREAEMLSEAGKRYVALLTDEPVNDCARRGLIKTQKRRCDLAKHLIERKRMEEAEKLLLGALNSDPSLLLLAEPSDGDGASARNALECVKQQLTAIETAPEPPEDERASCPCVGPRGSRGDRGPAGERGPRGRRGEKDDTGPPGRSARFCASIAC
jgi:hypothetical protein